MKVLLVYPDYPAGAPASSRRPGFYSEGIAALSATLKLGGHQVDLLHMTGPYSEASFKAEVGAVGPDVVGFSVRTSNFADLPPYVTWSREAAPGTPVVAGGCHATVEPLATLTEGGFDYVLRGEADDSLPALCEAVSQRRGMEEVGGLCWMEDGRMLSTPNWDLGQDLDALPIPDFGIFQPEKLETHNMRTVPALLSRGCPYLCTYCCNAAFRALYPNPADYVRQRSPGNSIQYLKEAIAACHQPRYVSFFDDIFPLRIPWLREFLALYREEIGLPFTCNARADRLTEEVALLLKQSGCFRIHMGIESGDPQLRASVLKRPVPQEGIIRGFDLAHAAGISTLSYNMVGLPDEDLGKALKTVKLNAQVSPHRAIASIFFPYPGTEGYRMAREEGYLKTAEPWRGDWVLDQPAFSSSEARFASAYFRLYLRLYQAVWALPGPLARMGERILDWTFTWRGKPHGLLVRLAGWGRSALDGVKALARRRASRLYLYLRDRSLNRKRGRRREESSGLRPG